jgi:hypothetical protein
MEDRLLQSWEISSEYAETRTGAPVLMIAQQKHPKALAHANGPVRGHRAGSRWRPVLTIRTATENSRRPQGPSGRKRVDGTGDHRIGSHRAGHARLGPQHADVGAARRWPARWGDRRTGTTPAPLMKSSSDARTVVRAPRRWPVPGWLGPSAAGVTPLIVDTLAIGSLTDVVRLDPCDHRVHRVHRLTLAQGAPAPAAPARRSARAETREGMLERTVGQCDGSQTTRHRCGNFKCPSYQPSYR